MSVCSVRNYRKHDVLFVITRIKCFKGMLVDILILIENILGMWCNIVVNQKRAVNLCVDVTTKIPYIFIAFIHAMNVQ